MLYKMERLEQNASNTEKNEKNSDNAKSMNTVFDNNYIKWTALYNNLNWLLSWMNVVKLWWLNISSKEFDLKDENNKSLLDFKIFWEKLFVSKTEHNTAECSLLIWWENGVLQLKFLTTSWNTKVSSSSFYDWINSFTKVSNIDTIKIIPTKKMDIPENVKNLIISLADN